MSLRESFKDTSIEDIKELEDEVIEKAVFLPQESKLSHNIFSMVVKNVDSAIITAGMDGRIVGIDKDKLERMGSRRGIFLPKYDFFVDDFISKYLKFLNKEKR